MGMSNGYLQKIEKIGDFSGAQLVTLGNYLDTNPFEPYFPLLHHLARPTRTEREQAIKIAELEAQLLALEKERDWLKEVVMRK